MLHDAPNRRMVARLALNAAAILSASVLTSAVCAQGFLRSPTINIGTRMPTINPNVGANIAGRVNTPSVHAGAGSRAARAAPVLPFARYSPNLYPVCDAADRDVGDRECLDQTTAGGGGSSAGKKRGGNARRNGSQAVVASRTYPNELVAEIDGALSDAEADELARRHGLARVASQNFPLLGATVGLFRITDRRPLDTVSRELAAEAGVRSVQPNYRYLLQEQKAAPIEGDPAQYALAKLRLPEAHTLAHGIGVRIAVIDSGIDQRHPELAGSIAESFDALGSKEGPHVHGTGVAGVIASHARLMGSAPAAKIIAIRAFAQASGGAASSSYVILKALDYAVGHGAQIVNMSFAGPKDPLIERSVAATAARGIAMVAAAGNAGAKSPPLYPAANPNVIAVSATDAEDKLFSASNRGGYIALVAPGVDIFLPAPDDKYQMTSGTSFSAAYVSGLAALMLERSPALKVEELRAILMNTARDLGSPGRDDLFGAGEADAYTAVEAAIAAAPAPMAAAESSRAGKNAPERQEKPPIAEPVREKASTGAEGVGGR